MYLYSLKNESDDDILHFVYFLLKKLEQNFVFDNLFKNDDGCWKETIVTAANKLICPTSQDMVS